MIIELVSHKVSNCSLGSNISVRFLIMAMEGYKLENYTLH